MRRGFLVVDLAEIVGGSGLYKMFAKVATSLGAQPISLVRAQPTREAGYGDEGCSARCRQ